MKLKSLKIERAESWQPQAGLLVGHAELVDEDGSAMRVALSNAAVIRVLEVIKTELADTAVLKAKDVKKALKDAVDEGLLTETNVILVGQVTESS